MLCLFGWVLALPCLADEYYEFYRVTCTPVSFEVEHVGYWNIGEEVWPQNGDWEAHVLALKQWERKGFYVFDEWYGHYERPVVNFRCGEISTEFHSKRFLRGKGAVGSRKPVRMGTTIFLRSKNRSVVEGIPIHLLTRLALEHKDGVKTLEWCFKEKCKRYGLETTMPITASDILKDFD